MSEEILAFPTQLLEKQPEGFFKFPDYYLQYASFYPRDMLEENPTFKQVIPYAHVRYNNKVLIYERKGSEKRLHSLFSLGFGGHVNKHDKDIYESLKREISEELIIDEKCNVNFVFKGFINDNSDDVNKVHIGFSYEITTDLDLIKPSDETNLNFSWVNISDLDYNSFENWSKLVIKNLLN